MIAESRAQALQGLILALWLGAAVFFSLVVARAAFAVLPTRSLAGALVGRTLPVLFIAGIVAGVLVLALEWQVARTGPRPARGHMAQVASALVLVVACGAAQFAVSPRIERLRQSLAGPLDSLPAGDPQRAAFGRLHAISVGWLAVAIVAAGVALFLLWRGLDARAGSFRSPTLTEQTDG